MDGLLKFWGVQVSLIYRVDLQPPPAAPAAGMGPSKYRLQVVDSLPGLGAVRSLVLGEAASSAAEWAAISERGPPSLVAAVGAGRAGALAVLRPSLVPELVTEVPLPGE